MLIDTLLPDFQFRERHQLLLEAVPGSLIDAALQPDSTADAWIRAFIRLREWPARLGLGGGLGQRHPFGIDNFTLLARDGEREVVLGLAGRFWQLDYGLLPVPDAAAFAQLNQAGIARLVLNFSVTPVPGGRICLASETRVCCNSRSAYIRFLPYWILIRPVSGLIRRRLLARIRDSAAPDATHIGHVVAGEMQRDAGHDVLPGGAHAKLPVQNQPEGDGHDDGAETAVSP